MENNIDLNLNGCGICASCSNACKFLIKKKGIKKEWAVCSLFFKRLKPNGVDGYTSTLYCTLINKLINNKPVINIELPKREIDSLSWRGLINIGVYTLLLITAGLLGYAYNKF